jgi:hypothetical protein
MDIIATCLSGIVVKIYDDFTENNIIQEGFLKECLHTLSCFLLGASSMNDFTYVIMSYVINLAYHFGDSLSFSENKEKSILYMYPIYLFLSLPSIRKLNIVEIIVLIMSTLVTFGEASFIKEDVSLRKLTMRLGWSTAVILIIFLFAYFDLLTTSILKLFLFGLFYLLTSCVFQSYELFFKHVKIGINIDETPFKNIKQYMASNII